MINWTSTRNIDYINIESIGSIHVHLNTLFFVSFNHKLTFTVIKKINMILIIVFVTNKVRIFHSKFILHKNSKEHHWLEIIVADSIYILWR